MLTTYIPMSYNHGKYFTFRLIGTELGRNLHKFTQFYNYKSFSYNKLGARNASRNVLYFPLYKPNSLYFNVLGLFFKADRDKIGTAIYSPSFCGKNMKG